MQCCIILGTYKLTGKPCIFRLLQWASERKYAQEKNKALRKPTKYFKGKTFIAFVENEA